MCDGKAASASFCCLAAGTQKTFLLILALVGPGDAQLVRRGFSGCLRDVTFKMTDSPAEGWTPLDWSTATNRVAAYQSWEGCPLHSVDGAHFLGHGETVMYPSLALIKLFSHRNKSC